MRIIKEGKVPHYEWYFVCPECGTEFAADEHDRVTIQYNESAIECPVCKRYNDWDKGVKHRINE